MFPNVAWLHCFRRVQSFVQTPVQAGRCDCAIATQWFITMSLLLNSFCERQVQNLKNGVVTSNRELLVIWNGRSRTPVKCIWWWCPSFHVFSANNQMLQYIHGRCLKPVILCYVWSSVLRHHQSSFTTHCSVCVDGAAGSGTWFGWWNIG